MKLAPLVLFATCLAIAIFGCRGEEADASNAPAALSDRSTSDRTGENGTSTPPPATTRDPAPVRPSAPSSDRDLAIRLGLAPAEPLHIASFLTHADVREIFAFDGELTIRTLEGIEPNPSYNAVRLGADDGYGFALQLWRLDETRQVNPRYDRLRQTYITALNEDTSPADAAFTAEFEGIRHYVFAHRASRTVGAVTCQTSLCTAAQLRDLAVKVVDRL